MLIRVASEIKPGDRIRIKGGSAIVSASYPSPVLEGGWRLTIDGEDYPVPPDMEVEIASQALERTPDARPTARPHSRH
jgi:hypothetical protein